MKFAKIIAAMISATVLSICFSNLAQAAWWNPFSHTPTTQPVHVAPKDPTYPSLTTPQVKDVQRIVGDYLVAQPEILIKASQALQKKQAQAAEAAANNAIKNNTQKLFEDANSPVAGNPQGSVILVEFFDYQCGHCKSAATAIDNLVKKNPNLKVIYKEFPIFGASSTAASQAALAANLQGKYQQFHDMLFSTPGKISQDILDASNQSLGLSATLTKTQQAAITAELTQNRELAQQLQIRGTPAFILSNQDYSKTKFIPGSVPEQQLQQAIDSLAATNPASSPAAPSAPNQ